MSNNRPLSEDPKYQVGECQCESCRGACKTRPGFFRPEQIAPLARRLKLTTKQLFQEHLQVDFWNGHPSDVFMLVPKRKGEDGGSMSGPDPRGTCHWFVDGKCAIHENGKPAECQGLGHKDGANVGADREAIVDAWRSKQRTVRNLYGKKLEAPDFSLTDMLSLMSPRML